MNPKSYNFGVIGGYLISFVLFSIIFYFLLSFSHKLPENWNYFYVSITLLSVILFGALIKLSLK